MKFAVILTAVSIGLLIFSIDIYMNTDNTGTGYNIAAPEYEEPPAPIYNTRIIERPYEPPLTPPYTPSVFDRFFDLTYEEPQPAYTVDIHTDYYPRNTFTVSHPEYRVSAHLRDKIETLINSYPRRVAFYVLTMDETISIGYNPDDTFPTASTIKAPYALYCYNEIAKGNVSLFETKTYESRFTRDGSGILADHPVGGEYTIEQLLYYTLFYSDNIAYYMCLDRFGRQGYNDMLEEIGTTQLYLRYGRSWSEIAPRDMVMVWREIYKFTGTCAEGGIFFDVLLNATANLLDGALPHFSTLHKSGWTVSEYHDAGIVFSERPYYITICTNGNTADRIFVRDMIQTIDEIIREYHLYTLSGGE